MEYDSEQIDPETSGEGENKIETREAGGVWHDSITIGALLDFSTFQNGETNFFQSHSGSRRKNHIIASAPPLLSLSVSLGASPLLPALLFRALQCVQGWGGSEKY